MHIELKHITVKELIKDYKDNLEQGVKAYSGLLDVRPPYQREFVYKDSQREAVIDTLTKNFPLNVMYWAVRDDGTFEIIDGQQRTISICQYVEGDFSYKDKNSGHSLYFHNLPKDKQDNILDYELMVYFCKGTDSEKLDWFKTINISGEKLTDQELRNAVYAGSWVSDAKRYFSKTGCPAYAIASDLVNGSPIRQEYLETAIKWMVDSQSNKYSDIESYMAKHQSDANALELWQYFQSVITWVEATFIKKRKKYMKGLAWGEIYNKHKDKILDKNEIEARIAQLIADDEVESKKGIYTYVLDGDEKHLSLRSFSDSVKQKVFEQQQGVCPHCKQAFSIEEMEGDHIDPWSQGGKTTESNCQMLCKPCNRRKSSK